MKCLSFATALFVLFYTFATANFARAQISEFTYQGLVRDHGTNFNGVGQFKFALVTVSNANATASVTAKPPSGGGLAGFIVNYGGSGYVTAPAVTIGGGGGSGGTAVATISDGAVTSVNVVSAGTGYTSAPLVNIAPPPPAISTTTWWSNDGTSTSGSQPTDATSLSVTNGLFTIVLGDLSEPNMEGIPEAIFAMPEPLQLRIWFNDGTAGFAQLSPDQNLTPTPYAIYASMAGSASNLVGTISSASLPANPIFSGTVSATSFVGNGTNLYNVNAASLNGQTAYNFWQLGGNTGTSPAMNYVGTADNMPMEIHVNGARALRLEPDASGTGAPNVIGGSPANAVQSGAFGAVISGGGATSDGGVAEPNMLAANFGVISGGEANQIQSGSQFSVIAGGDTNLIAMNATDSSIAGGGQNQIQAGGNFSAINGGRANQIQTNCIFDVIGGGVENQIQDEAVYSPTGDGVGDSTICGGLLNSIKTSYATIAGGEHNSIGVLTEVSFIGGGYQNQILDSSRTGPSGEASVIVGGEFNLIFDSAYASFIGGGEDNDIYWDANSSTVGGGQNNSIGESAPYSTIAGGYLNTIDDGAMWSTISGGQTNYIGEYAIAAIIAGGEHNAIGSGAIGSAIIGGSYNAIQSGNLSFIGGGGENNIQGGSASTIAGGEQNQIQTGVQQCAISGGAYNNIGASVLQSAIAGGTENTILANASMSSIGGGFANTNAGTTAIIGGGSQNMIGNASNATIAGGNENMIGTRAMDTTIAGGTQNEIEAYANECTIGGGNENLIETNAVSAVIGGGYQNIILTNAAFATIPGGANNVVGGAYAFAAGQSAQALHQGAFVWADSQYGAYASTVNDSFNIRAQGGVFLDNSTPAISFGNATRQMLNLYGLGYGIGVQNYTEYFRSASEFAWYAGGTHNNSQTNSGGGTTLMTLSGAGLTVNGTLASTSDRNAKEDFSPVNPQEVLAKVASMPITKWAYKTDTGTRHIGPMAQDFYAAFAVGPDDRHITTVDEGGVALAAIQGMNQQLQGMNQKVHDKDAEIETLKAQNAALAQRLDQLAAAVRAFTHAK